MVVEQGRPTPVRPDRILGPDGEVIADLTDKLDERPNRRPRIKWPTPSDSTWAKYQGNVRQFLRKSSCEKDSQENRGESDRDKLHGLPHELLRPRELPRIAAALVTSLGLLSGGVKMADSQGNQPIPTAVPQGIQETLPQGFPSAQDEYKRRVRPIESGTKQQVKTEPAVKPEQEKGVDFSTIDTAMSGNTLVALVRPEGDDGSAYVASLNLDKIDLSSGTLLIEAKHKVPFVVQMVGGAIAISPVDPNHIMVFGFTVPFFGKYQGALLDIDRQNAVFVQGDQAEMFGGQFEPAGQWAFIPQSDIVNPRISSWAKFSVAERRIVANLTNDGVYAYNLTPFFAGPAPDSYSSYGMWGDGPGYVAININGDTITTEVKSQKVGRAYGKLLFFLDGTDKMIGLMDNDTTAPGDENQPLPTVYIDKNDIFQYKFQPALADFYSLMLPADIAMASFTHDSTERNFYTDVSVTQLPMSQNVRQYFIEVVPQDDPNNPAKRKLIIPTINGQQITALATSYGISSIYSRYINREHYLLLGGDFGLAVAKAPALTERISTLEFKPIKLHLPPPPNIFLPMIQDNRVVAK